MKKVIRKGIFETNSSSIHAIVIPKKEVEIPQEKIDVYISYPMYFGWEKDTYISFRDKIGYLLIIAYYWAIANDKNPVKEIYSIIEKLRNEFNVYVEISYKIKIDISDWESGLGSIDHVSESFIFYEAIMNNNNLLSRYLFGGTIYTNNDNDDYFDKWLDKIDYFEQSGENEVFLKEN